MSLKQLFPDCPDDIELRGGTTTEHTSFTGASREITVDTTKNTLVVHDGTTAGGFPAATASSVPTKLSQLTDGITMWKKSELTKVSQLSNDAGYWVNLSKVSHLQNDLNWKTAHCTYCTHCTYCAQCSRCNQVKCTQVKCGRCSGYCTSVCGLCSAACYNCSSSDCGDDSS